MCCAAQCTQQQTANESLAANVSENARCARTPLRRPSGCLEGTSQRRLGRPGRLREQCGRRMGGEEVSEARRGFWEGGREEARKARERGGGGEGERAQEGERIVLVEKSGRSPVEMAALQCKRRAGRIVTVTATHRVRPRVSDASVQRCCPCATSLMTPAGVNGNKDRIGSRSHGQTRMLPAARQAPAAAMRIHSHATAAALGREAALRGPRPRTAGPCSGLKSSAGGPRLGPGVGRPDHIWPGGAWR